MKRVSFGSSAHRVALVGICAAIIECAKLALTSLPNIEAVTLLVALFGYSFGGAGVLASILFVCIEPLIWGVNTWVVSYFLYWPALALLFAFLRRAGVKNRFILTLAAVISTAWFGVLTSLIDVGLFTGYYDNFFYRFGIYYTRGLPFYATQILTNAVLFPTLFKFLSAKLEKIQPRVN